jgi:hypothetical protein
MWEIIDGLFDRQFEARLRATKAELVDFLVSSKNRDTKDAAQLCDRFWSYVALQLMASERPAIAKINGRVFRITMTGDEKMIEISS